MCSEEEGSFTILKVKGSIDYSVTARKITRQGFLPVSVIAGAVGAGEVNTRVQ